MKIKETLNQLLADLHQMLTLTYQVHWYMRGERFLVLHPMLDDYIKEYQSYIDEVAELLIMQGGAPYSTLQELANHSKLEITKGDYELSISEQLEKLLSGLEYMDAEFNKVIKIADEEGTQSIVDAIQGMKSATEKHLWMIKAELGRPVK